MSVNHVYIICQACIPKSLLHELYRRGFHSEQIREIHGTGVDGHRTALLNAKWDHSQTSLILQDDFQFDTSDGKFKSVKTYVDICLKKFEMTKADIAFLTTAGWTGYLVRLSAIDMLYDQFPNMPESQKAIHCCIGKVSNREVVCID